MAQLTELKIALKLVGISDTDLASTYFFDSARQQLTAAWVKYRFAYVISQTPAASLSRAFHGKPRSLSMRIARNGEQVLRRV